MNAVGKQAASAPIRVREIIAPALAQLGPGVSIFPAGFQRATPHRSSVRGNVASDGGNTEQEYGVERKELGGASTPALIWGHFFRLEEAQ